jgi:hypothetical protein
MAKKLPRCTWHARWFGQLVIACHPSSWLDDKKATSKACIMDLSSDLRIMTDLQHVSVSISISISIDFCGDCLTMVTTTCRLWRIF